MKKIIYILVAATVLFVAKPTKAQDRERILNMYYSMGLGTGDMADYISKYSWRGFGMEWKTDVFDNASLGFGAEWNVFYQDMGEGTYTRDNIALSGEQFRYANMFPMTARFNYFKDNAAGMRFFGGAGIGTTYMIHDLDMNIYRWNRDTWQFLIAPEVGVSYDISPDNTLMLSVKYNLNFKTKDVESQSNLSFNIGFGFR